MAIVRRVDRITELVKQRSFYSDLPSNMKVRLGTQDIEPLKDEDAVRQSITNLLLTNRGERPFRPTLGSDLKAMLFENMDSATESMLKNFITSTIEQYEPRALLKDVNVTADPDTNALVATVVFTMLNKTEPIVLDVLLNRVR